MSDEIMRINRRFLDLYDEIIAEINAVSLNLENLSDELITDEDYYSTSLRLEHIHNLFDKVSDVLKELPLTQDNPDLYSLLEKKKLLNRLFGELSGLEHTLSREHNRAKGKDDELVPERELNPPLPEVIEEEPLEEPDLELFPEDDIEPEVIVITEGKKERKTEYKEKQETPEQTTLYSVETNGYSSDPASSYSEEEKREWYKEEAARLHMPIEPGKEYSEADIRNEQLRRDDELAYEAERVAERKRFEQEALDNYYEKIKPSDASLEKSHNDFSYDKGSEREETPRNDTEPKYPEDTYSQVTPNSFEKAENLSNLESHEKKDPVYPDFSYNTIYAFTPDGILTQDYSQVNIGHSIPQYNSYIPFMPDGTPFHKFDDVKVESTQVQHSDRFEEIRMHTSERYENLKQQHSERSEPYTPHTYEPHHREAFSSPSETYEQKSHASESYIPESQVSTNYVPKTQIPESHGPQPFSVHNFTAPEINQSIINDNNRIFNMIMHAAEDTPKVSTPHDVPYVYAVSSAYDAQMRFNVQMARLDYEEKKNTPEGQEAIHTYLEQRNAYAKFKEEVRSGSIKIDNPYTHTSDYKAKKEDSHISQNSGVQYNYTPFGVSANTFEKGKLTNNSYNYLNPKLRSEPSFSLTPDTPIKVSPDYEAALYNRMAHATTILNKAVESNKGSTFTVPGPIKNELTLATDAWLGYRKAKRDGVVIVSEDSNISSPLGSGISTPNLRIWQTYGTTAYQNKIINPNKVSKDSVEEIDPSLFKKESLLKRESYVTRALANTNYAFQNFTISSLSITSRKLYQLMQCSDESAPQTLRTIENARYYSSTTIGLVRALHNPESIHKVANSASKAAAREFKMFGTLVHENKADIARDISERTKLAKINKAEIKELIAKGHNLTEGERTKLVFLLKEHVNNTGIIRKETGYLKHSGNSDLLIDTAKAVDFRSGGKITPDAIRTEISNITHEANLKMKKKFGSLVNVTDKSLNLEISDLLERNKALKGKIKALELKGSSLTSVERKKLKMLIDEHKKLSGRLSTLIGLKEAREELNSKLDYLKSQIKKLSRDSTRRSNSLFALSNFILRPLRESDQAGAQGISRALALASDYRVRFVLRQTMRGSFFLGKVGMEAMLPGSTEAIKTTTLIVKNQVSLTAALTKKTIKTGVNTAALYSKNVIVSHTPQGVRTAIAKTVDFTRGTRFAVQRVIASGKDWFANTTVGRGLSFIRRISNSTAEFVKATMAIVKSVLTKFIVGFALFFLIAGLITVITTSFASIAGSSVILVPKETEGKLDLSDHVAILQAKQNAFDEEISKLQNSSKYDRVTVSYGSASMNNMKEMLSMMAVYLGQDVDVSNTQVKHYLESLYDDSHFHIDTETNYKCAGCKTKTVTVRIENEDGTITEEKKEKKYCPGHTDLDIEIYVLGFDEIFGADSLGNSGYDAEAGSLIGKFKITYYCTEKYPHVCNAGPPYKTATGTTPTPGRTIAVDPNIIPLGTHVIINGKEYIAEDTGGSIESYRIDICVKTHDEALKKGTQRAVPVYYPSYEGEGKVESGDWNGWTEDNIEWCKTIYGMDWGTLYTGIADYGGGIVEGGDLIVEGDFVWPVTSVTQSSGYGWRIHPVTGKRSFHKGTDIPVPVGTPVHAAADGEVTEARYSSSAGNMVVINHENGVITKYFHNSELLVKKGDKVKAGETISLSGNTGTSTGPHLHFEFWVYGATVDPRVQFGF